MKFNMPMAVFGGLALIAAAIYFGPGSQPVSAQGSVQPIALCNIEGTACADILNLGNSMGGIGAATMPIAPPNYNY